MNNVTKNDNSAIYQLLAHIQKPYAVVDDSLNLLNINSSMRELLGITHKAAAASINLSHYLTLSKKQLQSDNNLQSMVLADSANNGITLNLECLALSEICHSPYFLLIATQSQDLKLASIVKASFVLALGHDSLTLNSQAAQLLSLDPSTLRISLDGFLNCIKSSHRQRFTQAVNRIAASGECEVAEIAVHSFDGLILIHVELKALNSSDGQISSVKALLTDNSQSSLRRKKLEQTTGLISEIRAVTEIGIWEANLDLKTLYWSDETCKLFGVAPESFDGRNKTFLNLLLAEDRTKFGYDCVHHDGSFDVEYRIRRADNGELRWLYNRGKQVIDPGDEQSTLRLGVVMDITERKRLDQLHQLEARMLQALSSGHPINDILDMIVLGLETIVFDAVGSIMLADLHNHTLQCAAAPNLPKAYLDAIDGMQIAPGTCSCGSAAFSKQAVIVSDIEHDENWVVFKHLALSHDLRACWSTPVISSSGEILATFGVYYYQPRSPSLMDMQALERICQIVSIALEKEYDKKRLKLSEQSFRDVFDESATGVAITDTSGNFIEVNNAYCKMLGYTKKEMLHKDFPSLTHPDDRTKNMVLIDELLSGQRDHFLIEKRYISKADNIIWVRMSVTVQRNGDGEPIRIVGISENITDRVHAEQQLSGLFMNLPGMAYRCQLDEYWTMLFVSPGVKTIFGYAPKDIIQNTRVSMAELIHPDDKSLVDKAVQKAVNNGTAFQVEYRVRHADGSERWVWEQGKPIEGEQQGIMLLDGYITDITELKLADMALKQSEQRFQLLSKATNDAIWDWDLVTNNLWWNEGFENLFGFLRDEIKPTIESWTDGIHPEDRENVLQSIEAFIEDDCGKPVWMEQYRFRKADGDFAHVIDRAFLIRDEQSHPVRMVGGMNDISEQLQLEERLRQSQRLESLGQLTGGVAHDFNNLLTVMQGNAEMIADRVNGDEMLTMMADMIVSAAYRGAELTQSLLAFARRQPLNPKSIDVNALIQKIQPLLVRTLGEHIKVDLALDTYFNNALVDPGLLENAMLNLSINSRDAMRDGGSLTIETRNTIIDEAYAEQHAVSPGTYVQIAFSDTGCGIALEHLSHVFEPFFTTKSKSEGTGLGLAMVYGFVNQSGGHVSIHSEPQLGTTLKLFFPVSHVAAEVKGKDQTDHGFSRAKDNEVILLVEDDEMVRHFAHQQLTMHGYQIIQATNGHEALEILKSNSTIDLLFTDVVMPGMSGKELVDKALGYHPQLKVLYTSGYAEDAIVHQGRIEPGVLLLSKPYRPIELAQKIRQAIDG